jgi:hypothetical protein
MLRLVLLYLGITGIGAFIALSAPGLVVVGLFLGILPGLVLAVMPTAFLWGVAFALPWFLLRAALGDQVAIIPAALIGAAAMWFIPATSALASRTMLNHALAPDVIPHDKIKLAGDILLEVPILKLARQVEGAPEEEFSRRPYQCTALCAALLATPGVTSVTLNAIGEAKGPGTAMTGSARRFRIVPKAQCRTPSISIDGADELSVDRLRPADWARNGIVRSLQAEWDVRLATTDCVVVEAPDPSPDMVVRIERYRIGSDSPTRSDFSFLPSPIDVERLVISDRTAAPLLSKMRATGTALSRPLNIATTGGMENFSFRLGRTPTGNAPSYPQFNPDQLLADHSNLHVDVDQAAVIAAARAQLALAVANPALPASDAAFKLVPPWLNSLSQPPLSADDIMLLKAVIRDSRVRDFNGLWIVVKTLGPASGALREPLVDRIATLDWRADKELKLLGAILDKLPPGTFAVPSAKERAILADPDRRTMASGLIVRLADQGAAAVPQLLDLLDYHLAQLMAEREKRYDPTPEHMIVIDRVRMALCRLGPAGASALPRIEALMTKSPAYADRMDGREWQLMLARIGKPIRDIAKPADISNTVNQFHANLQSRLDHFNLDRDCQSQWS